jgi:hypothetical protein
VNYDRSRVLSCSRLRLAFSKFLLLFVVSFSVLLSPCSSFLLINNLFYMFSEMTGTMFDVVILCRLAFVVCRLLRDILCCCSTTCSSIDHAVVVLRQYKSCSNKHVAKTRRYKITSKSIQSFWKKNI